MKLITHAHFNNGLTKSNYTDVAVRTWMGNYIPLCYEDVIIYACPTLSISLTKLC